MPPLTKPEKPTDAATVARLHSMGATHDGQRWIVPKEHAGELLALLGDIGANVQWKGA